MSAIPLVPITPGTRPGGPTQNVEVRKELIDKVITRLNGVTTETGEIDIAGDATIGGDLQVDGALNVDGVITANGSTITLGDGDSDNVVFSADVNSNIIPNTDNAFDLGSGTKEWRDLFIDGTANIDSLVADTADINAGTIDGAIIGGSSAAAITGTAITSTTTTSVGSALTVGTSVTLAKELAHTVKVEASTTTDAAGGALIIEGGAGDGAGNGGDIDIKGGTSPGGNQGSVNITGVGVDITAASNIIHITNTNINPEIDNTITIGTVDNAWQDANFAGNIVKKQNAAEGRGLMTLRSKAASKTFAGGATEDISIQVPAGALLVSAQLRVDVAITGPTASWSAAYLTGSTQSIAAGKALAKNTKADTFFDANANAAITTGATDIRITPNDNTLAAGAMTAIVYYYELTSLTDAA